MPVLVSAGQCINNIRINVAQQISVLESAVSDQGCEGSANNGLGCVIRYQQLYKADREAATHRLTAEAPGQRRDVQLQWHIKITCVWQVCQCTSCRHCAESVGSHLL
jgi:hypothetical protein